MLDLFPKRSGRKSDELELHLTCLLALPLSRFGPPSSLVLAAFPSTSLLTFITLLLVVLNIFYSRCYSSEPSNPCSLPRYLLNITTSLALRVSSCPPVLPNPRRLFFYLLGTINSYPPPQTSSPHPASDPCFFRSSKRHQPPRSRRRRPLRSAHLESRSLGHLQSSRREGERGRGRLGRS